MMDSEEIQKLLPQRYPMLMVDRVLEVDEEAVAIVAQKNVSHNEPFFQGHFPGRPIMPGVLMLEAMAQTGLLCLFHLNLMDRSADFYFAGIDRARFRRAVVPGDLLRIEVKLLRSRQNYWRMEGVASVDGEIAVEATMTAVTVTASKSP